MKRHWIIFIILVLELLFCGNGFAQGEAERTVRKSILSGSWYPGNRTSLKQQIQRLLRSVPVQKKQGRLLSLVVPHAGYMYSGQVAAYAYKLIEGMDWKRIVIIGPSHRAPFPGISVNIQKAYETPFGLVPVDQEFGRRLINSSPDIRFIPYVHAIEHSIEIQIPFLQSVLKGIRIVPVLMGQQDLNTCTILSNQLRRLISINDSKTLIIASSDLSHYHDYKTAKRMDAIFMDDLKRLDVESLILHLKTGRCEACGGGPVITAILFSKSRGANLVTILKSANSGDVTGNMGSVVGYCAAGIWIRD